MLKGFKEFAMRGNVLDMAVGIIIGAAFGKIVASLVDDVLMPPLGKLLGPVNFTDYFISLNGTHYETLVEAKKAAAPTIPPCAGTANFSCTRWPNFTVTRWRKTLSASSYNKIEKIW